MATTSSIGRTNPKLQAIFGNITSSEDAEIRNILRDTDLLLLDFANHFGANRAVWEGTGLDLI